MSVEKIQRDITDLFNYPSDQNPTTQQDYIAAVKNWVETIVNLVDCNLWQPETEYSVGNYLRTPSLPSQVVLRCVSAGISGTQEPDYTDAEIGDTIADGSIEWTLQTMASLNELEAYFAEIISRIENGEGIVDSMWETDLETDIQPITASNVVPKVNGTGTLGTSNKKWANVYTNGLTVSGTATAVTPSTHDDSTKIATTEYVQDELSDYLQLSGGTMTGDISSNANGSFVIKHNGQEQGVQIFSGENDNFDGATLQLFAPQHSTYAGQFWLRASSKTSYDDTDATHKSYELTGKPDGTLSWRGKNILTVDDIYYKAGDTFSFTEFAPATGFITSGRKEMYASIVLPKRLDNINSITCNSIRGGIRIPAGGYVQVDNTDLKSVYNVAVGKLFGCNIRIQFSSTNEITSAVNNTPLAFVFNSMSLTFN